MTRSSLKIAAVTCAKNEGPFVLEWIAYHKLIGFTDVIVFTNDCTDGTDDLLDRLDEMHLIRHLPNPRLINSKLRFQAAALQYASQMREVRNADWRLSFDADEFVSVSVGAGQVEDLLAHNADAQMVSICQLQFGCSHRDAFEPGLSIEQFNWHQSYRPEPGTQQRRDLTRGFKTFIRADAPVAQWNNHLPLLREELAEEPVWIFGNNRPVEEDVYRHKVKSLPAEGAYELAQLNHYATRSRESFLVQSHRGNAVKLDQQADVKYWKRYNHNAVRSTTMAQHVPELRAMMDDWLSDPELRRRQDTCNERHADLIRQLKQDPHYVALYNRVSRLDDRAHREKREQA